MRIENKPGRENMGEWRRYVPGQDAEEEASLSIMPTLTTYKPRLVSQYDARLQLPPAVHWLEHASSGFCQATPPSFPL